MNYKYLLVDMLDLSDYTGYIPTLGTYRGHPTNGKTILIYTEENAPDNEALMDEEEYLEFVNQYGWGINHD